jgi:hypothetical protein
MGEQRRVSCPRTRVFRLARIEELPVLWARLGLMGSYSTNYFCTNSIKKVVLRGKPQMELELHGGFF